LTVLIFINVLFAILSITILASNSTSENELELVFHNNISIFPYVITLNEAPYELPRNFHVIHSAFHPFYKDVKELLIADVKELREIQDELRSEHNISFYIKRVNSYNSITIKLTNTTVSQDLIKLFEQNIFIKNVNLVQK